VAGLTGVKELLEGPSGTGKTYAIGTAVDWCAANGVESFVLFTEQGLETLLGYYADKGKPVPASLHWHVMEGRPLSLAQLTDAAKKVGMLSYDSLTKLSDPMRSQNNSLEKILTVMCDFPCDQTGKRFGPVDGWKADRFLWIDGLTELTVAITKSVIGNKPTMAPPDYGLAQNQLMNLLRLLTQGCACHFGLIAHVSREKDEISGGIKLMTKAVGTAIAGDIPPLFSDVIYATREGDQFYWDTATAMVDVKTRNLSISAKIKPDFGPLLAKWKKRAEAGATKQEPISTVK
jgi:hypothetical protein